MHPETYDLAVIGAGAAGSTAAKMAARLGMRVVLFECDKLGGTCLNYGCDPTKYLLHAAQSRWRASADNAVDVPAPEHGRTWTHAMATVHELVARVRGGSHAEAVARQEERGITVALGRAHFVDSHTLMAGERQIRADQVLIATGYRAVIPTIPGLSKARWITNREAVSLDRLPSRIAILGAGPVGVEFSQIFSRFGAEVTVFEQASRILRHDDTEPARALQGLLSAEGIRFECDTAIDRVEPSGSASHIHWHRGDTRGTCEVDLILVAAGRAAQVEELALDDAGVATEGGRLLVRDTLQTSVSHIWAAGDVTEVAPFTHVASAQAKHVVKNLRSERPEPFDARAIPWATYTYPALAHVGTTEDGLREVGKPYRVLKVDFDEITRNVLTHQEEGLYKLLVGETGELLGAQILANHADELIAPIALAMRHGLTVRQVADTILPYPTMSEALLWAAAKFEGPRSVPSDVECSVRPCDDDD